MSTESMLNQVRRLIEKLQKERQQHVEAIERIDLTFAQLGLNDQVPSNGRRKRKAVTKSAAGRRSTGRGARRSRGKFAISGEESILNFIRSAGKPTTAQVNEHWQAEGRKGKADNTLTRLYKDKKIKRHPISGKRGSSYSIA